MLAEYRLSGAAFAGTVTLAAPDRVDDSGKRPVLRPRIMVRTTEQVRVEPGTSLTSPTRPSQKARVVSVTRVDPAAGRPAPAAIPPATEAAATPASASEPAATPASASEPAATPASASVTLTAAPVSSSASGVVEFDVLLELSGGMGRKLVAEPGSVPAVGERLIFTTLSEEFRRGGALPDPSETPWTHGGPPVYEESPA